MGFFKKPMLGFGYSNTKEKDQQSQGPSHLCRNIPSPTTGLIGAISSAGDILPSLRNILASTAVGSPGAGDVDRPAAAEGGSGQSRNPGENRTPGSEDNGADRKGFEMCESLGFESAVERMSGIHDLLTSVESYRTVLGGSSSPSASSRSISRARRSRLEGASSSSEDFPPLISLLDESGWPRYVLEKVRSDGRLLIFMVKNQRRRVVRTRSADDGLITRLVVPDD
ncbi:hypothetical protein TorRG33x02_237750 [Trema orientale]|uniref:Uncharacterized protein n=1 Tax=Trema orientale TaxID=63057 RepID=A0A2P5DYU1_TREOI|nr:hypothetical protein TorRG33x02_237750 [Trema orientale]